MSADDDAKRRFLEAVELDPAAREDHMARLRVEDGVLHARVAQLLAAHARAEVAAAEAREEAASTGAVGIALPARLGNYELIEEIATGGSGVVYRARQLDLGRTVAVKLLRAGLLATEAELRRFQTEAEAAARLDHPSIVPVHEVGVCEGRNFISMKLIAGASLDRCAARFREPRAAAALVLQVARAIDHGHRHGVLHRDLKPSNILVDEQGAPYVADFGTAKLLDAEIANTVTGWIVGTPAYMAPEQAAPSGRVSVATDVYALGCVLYELLTGRPPFVGEDVIEILRQVREADPPPARSLRPDIHRDLETICHTCLAKEPSRRYESALALAEDLEHWLAFEPISARRATTFERLWLAWRRKPVVSTLAATVVLLLAVLVAGAIGAGFELQSRLRQTLAAEEDARVQLRKAELAEASAVRRADEVLRLSALQDYAELVARADLLWPPHPANIGAYEAWIEEARALVTDLPRHRQKRDELRAAALPLSSEEREAERRAHPQFARLEGLRGVYESRRAALRQRREGVAVELPELDWAALPKTASALNHLAWPLVGPNRDTYGREGEGLALAQRALELAREEGDDGLAASVGDTLAWALFGLGRDAEALEASRAALAVAPAARRAEFEKQLAYVEKWTSLGPSAEGIARQDEIVAETGAQLAALEELVNEQHRWRFPQTEAGRRSNWWLVNVTKLIELLEGLLRPASGLLSERADATSSEHGWSVPRRLAFARRLGAELEDGGEWRARWEQAIEAIRSHEAYAGLELPPQVGLVPIGSDPASGLLEFWHVATGQEPLRGEQGELLVNDLTGLVLVLIPGGSFWMGAQRTEPRGRNYDPYARDGESPPHEVQISPWFHSKYEMTQGQWSRFVGGNPSYYNPERLATLSLAHPVEQMSWEDCMRELARMGLSLPSEAQWEYACRAGTDTPWWTGTERESLRERHAANLADQAGARSGASWQAIADWPELDDGHGVHAPVGTYAANPFGLHEVHGNVLELCLDSCVAPSYRSTLGEDPVALGVDTTRVVRGGGFASAAATARSAYRFTTTAGSTDWIIGLRPARAIER